MRAAGVREEDQWIKGAPHFNVQSLHKSAGIRLDGWGTFADVQG